ncbi:MAG: N-acetyl-gamma-glutamyl-phosphate reductase [Bacteroidales bacterium]|jgi:N-acetyl-gamma-glutamyl-phosphate reductase
MNHRIIVSVAGGAGYTGGELIQLLLNHPNVQLQCVMSQSKIGMPLSSVHPHLDGETDLFFNEKPPSSHTDVLFLCLGHGRSSQFLEQLQPDSVKHVIDLSRDYRFKEEGHGRLFQYGLPELFKEPDLYEKSVMRAGNIANPGCFATAIELGLLPLAHAGLLRQSVHIHAITGATGAGAMPGHTTHYAWRSQNVSVYKPFQHQHIPEIEGVLSAAGKQHLPSLYFVPLRGGFSRGILASIYTPSTLSAEVAVTLYKEYYELHPFVHVSEAPVSLKEVVNTNKCKIHIEKHKDVLYITSVIDNLLKGASGTAVQNMNILFGLPQTTGLELKPVVF